MQIMIATVFNGLDAIKVRYYKARDVFRVARRILKRTAKADKKTDIKKVRAGDDWF